VTPAQAAAMARRRWQDIKASRVEDYLFIGGLRVPARIAAERVGVTPRTIERYKAQLRRERRLR
jgi:hypothetical protein